MARRSLRLAWLAGLVLAASGCATQFSPEAIRAEITRQTGQEPDRTLEVDVGRVTMALAKSALGVSADPSLPLSGLTGLQLGFYSMPRPSVATGTVLDFTRMRVRGWEQVVRTRDASRSAMVLVRESGDTLDDLVLLASGDQQVLYARLRGRLSRDLPSSLGDAVQRRGLNDVKTELMLLGEPPER